MNIERQRRMMSVTQKYKFHIMIQEERKRNIPTTKHTPQYVASLSVHWLIFLSPKGEIKLNFVIWSYTYLSGPQCWVYTTWWANNLPSTAKDRARKYPFHSQVDDRLMFCSSCNAVIRLLWKSVVDKHPKSFIYKCLILVSLSSNCLWSSSKVVFFFWNLVVKQA